MCPPLVWEDVCENCGKKIIFMRGGNGTCCSYCGGAFCRKCIHCSLCSTDYESLNTKGKLILSICNFIKGIPVILFIIFIGLFFAIVGLKLETLINWAGEHLLYAFLGLIPFFLFEKYCWPRIIQWIVMRFHQLSPL
jgi:hypothetical protein